MILTLEAIVIIALIGVNGVLAMSELAIVSARTHRLQRGASAGNRGAAMALALAKDPTRFLSTVQIGITLVGILTGVFGGARLAGRLSGWLQDAGLNQGLSESLGFAIVVISITYLTLIFGELVPKRIGLQAPERVASTIARPMNLLSRVASPFVFLLTFSTGRVLRLLGLADTSENAITEEEIRVMIGMSAESGSVADEEARLLDRIFHFGDRRVHEVLTPRTEVVGIERRSTVSDFYKAYAATPHSRFPVFDGRIDKVVGIITIKDILAAVARGEVTNETPVESLSRRALFVPETKRIHELFRQMQQSGDQMAIAVDEFGGTAGIVTLEQLLEEIVGAVGDELRSTEIEITSIDEMTVEVDGTLSVEEARSVLGIDIPEGDYDTIAGFVLSRLGHIPRVGEAIEFDNFRIAVAEMRLLKIEHLRVTRL